MPKYDLAAIQRNFSFHKLELPVFPGYEFTVALEIATRLVYFALDDMCRVIGIDTKTQRDKLTGATDDDGQLLLRPVWMPTAGGLQEKACLEFQNVGPWLITIQDKRVGDERAERLRLFKKHALRAVNLVLLGHVPAIPLKLPRGRPSLVQQLEDRVSQSEQEIHELSQMLAVQSATHYHSVPAGVLEWQATCPECGASLVVQAGTLHVVSASKQTDDN